MPSTFQVTIQGMYTYVALLNSFSREKNPTFYIAVFKLIFLEKIQLFYIAVFKLMF